MLLVGIKSAVEQVNVLKVLLDVEVINALIFIYLESFLSSGLKSAKKAEVRSMDVVNEAIIYSV